MERSYAWISYVWANLRKYRSLVLVFGYLELAMHMLRLVHGKYMTTPLIFLMASNWLHCYVSGWALYTGRRRVHIPSLWISTIQTALSTVATWVHSWRRLRMACQMRGVEHLSRAYRGLMDTVLITIYLKPSFLSIALPGSPLPKLISRNVLTAGNQVRTYREHLSLLVQPVLLFFNCK